MVAIIGGKKIHVNREMDSSTHYIPCSVQDTDVFDPLIFRSENFFKKIKKGSI